jgi:hypothetical protein
MKRDAFRIVGTDPQTGRMLLVGSSRTREAAEKRARSWANSRGDLRHLAPYRVMTNEEFEAARGR